MSQRSFSVEAIVLKRRNYSEADRFVTVFSREKGKLEGLAKGVRKIKSRKRASLEPGNRVKIQFARGKSLDIITQTELLEAYTEAKNSMVKVTQLHQILEIIDGLTVLEEPQKSVYETLESSMQVVARGGFKRRELMEVVRLVLKDLGFTHDKVFSEDGLKEYIESLTNKRLKSKKFLMGVVS